MAQGHDVINLGQGNPDQPTPSHIVETLQKQVLILCIINILPFGAPVLKEAVATFINENMALMWILKRSSYFVWREGWTCRNSAVLIKPWRYGAGSGSWIS